MKRYISCCDRMCGADDCPNCNPSNFRGGIFVDDLLESELSEHSTEQVGAKFEPSVEEVEKYADLMAEVYDEAEEHRKWERMAHWHLKTLAETVEHNEQLWENGHATLRKERDSTLAKLKLCKEVLEKLVAKLEAIHNDPLYESVWFCAHNHGIDYTNGPKYVVEMETAKVVMVKLNEKP